MIFSYNVGRPESFEEMKDIYQRTARLRKLARWPSPWSGIIVALADDLSSQPDAVPSEAGMQCAHSKGMDFFSTSAKFARGCTREDLVTMIAHLLFQRAVGRSAAIPNSGPSMLTTRLDAAAREPVASWARISIKYDGRPGYPVSYIA